MNGVGFSNLLNPVRVQFPEYVDLSNALGSWELWELWERVLWKRKDWPEWKWLVPQLRHSRSAAQISCVETEGWRSSCQLQKSVTCYFNWNNTEHCAVFLYSAISSRTAGPTQRKWHLAIKMATMRMRKKRWYITDLFVVNYSRARSSIMSVIIAEDRFLSLHNAHFKVCIPVISLFSLPPLQRLVFLQRLEEKKTRVKHTLSIISFLIAPFNFH